MKRLQKPLLFVAALLPLAWLGWGAWTDNLGVNPIETITHETGLWTLRLLLATLAITPLVRWFKWSSLVRMRRMFGLFAFFYGTLHLFTYLWFDKFFDWGEMYKDVMLRRFITIGFTAWLLMAPLAITSTDGWVRRLGGKRWQRLHRLAYAAAVAGVIHYIWLVKADVSRPLAYGVVLAGLFAARLLWRYRPQPARTRAAPSRDAAANVQLT